MVSTAWAYLVPVGSIPSSTATVQVTSCPNGEQICTLLKGPEETQVYHFSPGYRLWFSTGTVYTHHPDTALKEALRDNLRILCYVTPVFKNKESERIQVEESGSLFLPSECAQLLASEPSSTSDHCLDLWLLQICFHYVITSLGSSKVVPSPLNITNCCFVQIWSHDGGKLNKKKVAGRVTCVSSRQGCGFWTPQKRWLYKLALCNSLHSMWSRKLVS